MITHDLDKNATYFMVADDIEPCCSLQKYHDGINVEKIMSDLYGGDIIIDNLDDIFIYLGNSASKNKYKGTHILMPGQLILKKNKFYPLYNDYPHKCYSKDLYGSEFDIMNTWHECFLFVDEEGKKQLTRIKKLENVLKD